MMVVMLLSPLTPRTAAALIPPGSDGTNRNQGNPYTNGDLFKSTGSYWILNINTIQINVVDDIGYRPAPAWDLPIDLMNSFDPTPTAPFEWGLSDFHYRIENTSSYNPRGINFVLPDVLHCVQHDNETTAEGVGRYGALYLVNMTESQGVYTGQFLFWVRSFEPHDQATAGVNLITITWEDDGHLDLQKQSANPALSNNNACYKLGGAVYSVYSDSATTQKVAALTTDANGYAKTTTGLRPGSYWVRETTPAPGYALDTTAYATTVKPGETVRVNSASGGIVKDKPQNNPAKIFIGKVDAETTRNLPLGSASLAGAQFEVKYYDGYYTAANLPAAPLRTWIVETGKDGAATLSKDSIVGGDVPYTSSTGAVTLPLGTISIQEIKAPDGYLLGKRPLFIRQITSDATVESVNTYNAPAAPEQVKRGDLQLLKAAAVSYKRMAQVPFSITSATTGESHTIVTDANGHASTSNSWNPHSRSTNAGKTDEDGVWFGIDHDGNTAPVNDALGALPYDTYHIEELPCAANEGYQLIAPFDVTISRDTYEVDLGTLTNIAPAIPEIGTQAIDADSKTQNMIAGKDATVIDTVSYKNLEVGREYRITGALINQSTESTLTVSGRPVTAQATFSPAAPEGTVKVTFKFDASAFDDTRIVIFESLSLGGKTVATHAELSNGSQTIRIASPLIRTTATKQDSDAKVVSADKLAGITDTVLYSELIAERTYEIHGVLMDKHTGMPVISGGKEVSASKTFIADATSGTVTLDFSFDGRALGGHDVVAFETVKYKKTEIAVHADINNEGQTVRVLAPLAAPTPTPTPTPAVSKPKLSSVPSTGEATHPLIALAALLGLSGVILAGALFRKKRVA